MTYSDGFDGLPVPSPDGKMLALTSSRSGGAAGQLFLADWNHEKALEAIRNAPPRKTMTILSTRHASPEAARSRCCVASSAISLLAVPRAQSGAPPASTRTHVDDARLRRASRDGDRIEGRSCSRATSSRRS